MNYPSKKSLIENKKIAIFKPFNARHDNAFGTGQYEVFKSINELKGYEVTFFISDRDVYFKGVNNIYVKNKVVMTFIARCVRILFRLPFIKLPFYGNLNFDEYDFVVTEGMHYVFLKYFNSYKGMLILNDSVTSKNKISKVDYVLVNKLFENSLTVVVNDKIPVLYLNNKIELKTKVIGHSVQLRKINFKERMSFNGRILSIGRLTEEKGYIYIFSAIKELISNHPDLVLDVFGEGPLEKTLRSYIKNNKLEKNIFLKGFLEHGKLLEAFDDYDMFISHPIEMDHVAEAFHMGNMEAMASGLPVITTDCGGVPFVVKDNALVCRQRKVNEIIVSIENLLINNILINKISINGRKYIEENFSHEVIVAKWKEVFDQDKL